MFPILASMVDHVLKNPTAMVVSARLVTKATTTSFQLVMMVDKLKCRMRG